MPIEFSDGAIINNRLRGGRQDMQSFAWCLYVSAWLTCWYCFISRSLMAVSFRPLRLASLTAWCLVDRTKACKVHHFLRGEWKNSKNSNLATVQSMLWIKYETQSSPEITGASALKSGWSQTHKGFEDSEQRTLVSCGWAERKCHPTQSESTPLHLCASLFWQTPSMQCKKKSRF